MKNTEPNWEKDLKGFFVLFLILLGFGIIAWQLFRLLYMFVTGQVV